MAASRASGDNDNNHNIMKEILTLSFPSNRNTVLDNGDFNRGQDILK